MYTPETSRHFTKQIDPRSGMAFYVLTTRVAPLQQGFYFINSGCEDSRRYLWFYCSFPPSTGRWVGVVDFASDEVRLFPDTSGSGWLVDPRSGELYWGNSTGIYKRTASEFGTPCQIAAVPPEIKAAGGGSMGGTHLTFSPDRSELLIDVQTADGSFIGTVDVATGEYRHWYKTERGIPYNHAQFSPTDPNLVMVAHEVFYNPKTGKTESPALTADGIYPRLQLISRDGRRETRKPLNNYATHECWSADGRSIYYCSHQHIAIDDLAGKAPRSVCYIPIEDGNGTWHAHATKDGSCYIVDGSLPSMGLSWWRGCVSVVRFYNTHTSKLCDLISYNPVVNGWTPENPSGYHIDPHPRFVWDDEWVSFTTTVNGKVDVALAPVDQLLRATK